MIRKLQALKYGQAVARLFLKIMPKRWVRQPWGILILLSIGISTLLWVDLSNPLRLDCLGCYGGLWCRWLGR